MYIYIIKLNYQQISDFECRMSTEVYLFLFSYQEQILTIIFRRLNYKIHTSICNI